MNPNNIPKDDLDRMRAEVAREHQLTPWSYYTDNDAAEILGFDPSTVKRNRREGLWPYVPCTGRHVRFLGMQLCDIKLFGYNACLLWGGSSPKVRKDK